MLSLHLTVVYEEVQVVLMLPDVKPSLAASISNQEVRTVEQGFSPLASATTPVATAQE